MNEVGFGDAVFDTKEEIYLTKLKLNKTPIFPILATVQGEVPCTIQELKEREACLCGRWCPGGSFVLPSGPLDAKVVFVNGEPSSEDIEMGRILAKDDGEGTDFHAGSTFEWYLESLGLRREAVYITNAVMCRAFGQYYFDSSNLIECAKFKQREFEELTEAKYIFVMGTIAFQLLTGIFGPVSSFYGQYFVWKVGDVERYIIPLPNPARVDQDSPVTVKLRKILDGIRFGV